ncbi:MAG TPA: FAD-dependent monooxygenase [Pirellulales bacterium]|jgi:2-polyprenyl-6-methoxyphenol hydroxylase-like FAD-dependent oxidoreductase|nr:FAD-dependent monooxygenase [Pirellulales bacterium]
MPRAQVLIVGAGPTGLVLALWLTKCGISVRCIDAASGPGTTSRAMVLHARNLEFYHQLGIDQAAIREGLKFIALNLWARGEKKGRVAFGEVGKSLSPYAYVLIYPQDLHEQMLVAQLHTLGVDVEWNVSLVESAEHDARVSATIKTASGAAESIEVDYLAGCDGAHSTVREQLAIGFPGGTYAETFYVADIRGRGAVLDGELHVDLDQADFVIVFPMRGTGRARLIGTLREDAGEESQLEWGDVSQAILQRLRLEVDEVRWFSTYRVHHRVADHFQRGRTFLLGDAAHIHSPVGGQGMNTGIGDAVNLAWKLAAVLRGAAPDLLATYEAERIGFARTLVATTDRAFSLVTARGPIATGVRQRIVPFVLPRLFQIDFLRRFFFRTLSQLAIHYPDSPLSQSLPSPAAAGTTGGGNRLPWVSLGEEGASGDNFAPLVSRDWQLHRYGDASRGAEAWCRERGLALHSFPWSPAAQEGGLAHNTNYLIRPDGYVAIGLAGSDFGPIERYLERWEIAPGQQAG